MDAILAWAYAQWAANPTLFIALAMFMLALISLVILATAKRRKRKLKYAATTTSPDQSSEQENFVFQPLLVANLQGIGEREEQQDAFALSPLNAYEKAGLLAVLCDGMGGLAQGREIAHSLAREILERFSTDENDFGDWPNELEAINHDIYARYRGQGGTTLVMTYIKSGKLWFWCVGDSMLYLHRDGKLYELNERHEYANDLFAKALAGSIHLSDALTDPQKGALSQYLGNEHIACDRLIYPFPLKEGDTLLLCSDGISDTLNAAQLSALLCLSPNVCVQEMESAVKAAQSPNQDNFTAIIIKVNFKDGEEKENEKESA